MDWTGLEWNRIAIPLLTICSCNFDKDAKIVYQKNENLKKTALSQLDVSMERNKTMPFSHPVHMNSIQVKDLSKRSQILKLSDTKTDKMLQGLESLLTC